VLLNLEIHTQTDCNLGTRGAVLRCNAVLCALPELRLEKRLRARQAFFGQDDRFRLPSRVEDETLRMQPIHHVEIETLPRPSAIVQGQVEQREYRVIDLGLIVFYGLLPQAGDPSEREGGESATTPC
jgi:hypothetical protein